MNFIVDEQALYLALTLIFDVFYIWGSRRVLNLKKFPLYALLHMVIAIGILVLRYSEINNPLIDVLATPLLYVLLPIPFLKKINSKECALTFLLSIGLAVYGLGCSAAEYLLAGTTTAPVSISLEKAPLALGWLMAGNACFAILVYGLDRFVKPHISQNARPQELAAILFASLTPTLMFMMDWSIAQGKELIWSIEAVMSLIILTVSYCVIIAIALVRKDKQAKFDAANQRLNEALTSMKANEQELLKYSILAKQLRHDVNNQLQLASTLAESGQIDEAIAHLKHIQLRLDETRRTDVV